MTRYADIEDLPIVCWLCIMALEELADQLPAKPDPDRVIDAILSDWACAPCIILENQGEIIGFYGLTTYRPKYSNDTVLGDYMLYVKPDKRNYKALVLLSIAARDVADKFGLALDLNFITPANLNIKTRFLEKMGAKITGVKGLYDGR